MALSRFDKAVHIEWREWRERILLLYRKRLDDRVRVASLFADYIGRDKQDFL